MKWLGVVSLLCFSISYLPHLAKTYRTRRADGAGTGYWVLLAIGYLAGVLYVLPLNDLVVSLTYAVGLACALAMLTGSIAFRK